MNLRLSLIILFCIVVNSSYAQNTSFDDNPNISKSDSLSKKKDSIVISPNLRSTAFDINNIFIELPVIDTILDSYFSYFNILEKNSFPIIENGYIGSSARPLTGFDQMPGFNSGLNRYSLYDVKNTYYHINQVPFASLHFSPGSDVTEFGTSAIFSRNFKDVSVDIDYSRINNKGKYQGQVNKHTDLNFGLWKGSLNDKFNTFFNIIVDVHEEEINGGVRNVEDLKLKNNEIRISVPVKLNNAIVRKDNYQYILKEYYRIYNEQKVLGFKPFLIGKLKYENGFYKYYDDAVRYDSISYKNYLVDEIGIRNYYSNKIFESNLELFGTKSSRDYFKAGINYRLIRYEMEPLLQNNLNELSLYSSSEFNLKQMFYLLWDVKLFLGDFKGDYDLKFNLLYDKTFIKVSSELKIQRYSPSLYDQKLYVTNRLIYDNDFNKVNKFLLNGKIEIQKIGFSANFKYNLINGFIYYNKNLLPFQINDNINVIEMNIKENMKIGFIHFDNNIFLFKSSSDKLPLPSYTIQSKLYITPLIYSKKLLLNTGFEFNFWDKYNNYGLNAMRGNYYIQNDLELDNYMRLDYFFSIKVDDFLFFARFNNILFPFTKFVPYKVIEYPQSDMFFRYGVKWTLID